MEVLAAKVKGKMMNPSENLLLKNTNERYVERQLNSTKLIAFDF